MGLRTLVPALAVAAAAAGAAQEDTVTVTMSTRVDQPKPVSQRFVGYSIEVHATPELFGVGGLGGAPRKSFANLMNVLRQASGAEAAGVAGPNIRIGGNSGDESVYLPSGGTLPPGDTYRVTDADLQLYAAAVPAWNGTIVLDVNLRDEKDPSLSAAHVQAAGATVGWQVIEGVEVGNEIDLFSENGIRGKGFVFDDYQKDFSLYAASIAPLLPGGRRIQGATWCCFKSGWTLDSWGKYLDRFGPGSRQPVLTSMSYHRYPESACGGKVPTLDGLMADAAAEGQANDMKPYAEAALKAGLPMHIGEGNSVSCGGTAGVSDIFGSALWAVDALLNMARIGVSRWNFHGGPGGAYASIAYDSPSAPTDVVTVRPIFYGQWFFAAATANASVLHAVDVKTSNPLVKAYALKDGGGVWRVVLLHKDPSSKGAANASVTIVPPVTLTGAATVSRLLPGPNGIHAGEADAIAFGGLTFLGTPDGRPTGTPVTESVAPNGDGAFVVALPRASAAIVTLPPA